MSSGSTVAGELRRRVGSIGVSAMTYGSAPTWKKMNNVITYFFIFAIPCLMPIS